MRVGLTYDLRFDYLNEGYSLEETAEFDKEDTIAGLEAAIAAHGHKVERIGHVRALVGRLAQGHRWDLVFNIAEGMRGIAREAQVPPLLEAYGIACTFADAGVLTLCLHKGYTKAVLQAAGVATAPFAVVEREADGACVTLPYPLFVKPVAEGTGKGITPRELIPQHGVKNLIRIGTAGSMQEKVGLRDLVIAQEATTDSCFGKQFGPDGTIAAIPDFNLLSKAVKAAETSGLKYHVGSMLSSDIFYNIDKDSWKKWQKMGTLCVEMEAYALFLNAAYLGAAALTMVTISDSLITGIHLSQEEKETSFTEMMKVALSVAGERAADGK